MKVKLLILFLFFTLPFCFSQTEKTIKGKVLCEDFSLRGIEVLNLRSKRITITDTNGTFSILAKAKDTLMFVSKNYEYKKLVLEKEFIDKNNIVISLIRKPEQLDEVVVFSKKAFPHIGFNKEYADKSSLEKVAKNPKPYGVYDGAIENGMGKFINLSGSRKKKPEIEFKKIASATCNQNFFDKTLQLKSEEIALFLEFCDADPKSKTVLENTNPLKLLDFLLAKNIEFKKLLDSEKK